ncbi:MAG: FAD-binding oxidoreductase, partial [Actinomycetota bacterium]|nr:FAD-binding oxidoreductase [Actinomycetota bacterium]
MTATGNLTPSTTASAAGGAGHGEAPGSTAEAAALLRDTAGSVLVRGGGSKLAWGGRPAAPDVVIETRG